MRKIILTVIGILFFLSIMQGVLAACPEVILNKQEFLSGETLQAEINGNEGFTRDIISSDISIVRQRDNLRLSADIFVVKISKQKFFVFFEIPSVSVTTSENYVLKISTLCNNNFKLSSNIFIIKKPISKFYETFEGQVKNLWNYMSVEELTSSLMAFQNNPELFEQGKNALASKNCPGSCKNIENALALISLKQQTLLDGINNSKIIINSTQTHCWGNNINNQCDSRDTAFVLLALKLTENNIDEQALQWLSNNAVNGEEKAILVYLTKQKYRELISSQSINGLWMKNNNYDITTTALATFALNSIDLTKLNNSQDVVSIRNSISKAEQVLLEKFGLMSREEKAFTLYFVFPSNKIEAIISLWPGVIKTETEKSFSLIVKNKGSNQANILIEALNTNSTASLPLNGLKTFNFYVPLMTTPDERALFYTMKVYYDNSYGYTNIYNLPLIIFTEKGEMNINKSLETNQTIITPEEEEELKGQNQTNKTTESGNLIEKPIKFLQTEIKRELNSTVQVSVALTLENKLNKDVNTIFIKQSTMLIGIVTVDPGSIPKLSPGEKKTIIIKINPYQTGAYNGTIDATVKIDGVDYEDSVNFFADVKLLGNQTTTQKTCSELLGKECPTGEICSTQTVESFDSRRCCVPASSCKKQQNKSVLIGIIILGVVLAGLVTFYLIFSRKKHKQMSEILEEAKTKYESKFQRGFPR